MSFLFKKQKSPLEKFKPTGFTGGGITASPQGNTISVTPGAERTNLIGGIRNTFANLAGETAGLRAQVTPGFSALTKASLGQIESARKRTIGDLSQNLQNRRIFGSSFGQAAISQANAEFAQQSAEAEAQGFLQSLDLNNQLLQQEYTARTAQFQVALDELNLEAQIGSQLASQATSVMGANAQMQAQLQAQSSAGSGSFFGTLLGLGTKLLSGFGTGGLSTGASAFANLGRGLV